MNHVWDTKTKKILRVCRNISIYLLVHHAAYALNPVPGWYAGIFLGPTYTPNETFILTSPERQLTQNGTLSLSVLGNVGGEVGYAWRNFRVEAELLYNNNPYDTLTFSGISSANQAKIESLFPQVTITNQKATIQSSDTATGLTMQGATNTGAVMFNFYADLFTPNSDNVSNVVPYVGLGIGYVYVQNFIDFYYSGTELVHPQLTNVFQTGAAQAILGVSYFLDDFTRLNLDFRYFKSAQVAEFAHSENNTLITGDQFYGINLGFSGAFDAG